MKKISLYIFLAFLVLTAPLLNWYANSSTAIIFLIAALSAYLLLNLDKLEWIKLYGLEAKLRETITEANATIEQLKSLAAALSEPTISLIATNGIPSPMPFGYRQGLVDRINEILGTLNISQNEIQQMNQVYTTLIRVQHQWRIIEGINNPPPHLTVVNNERRFPNPDDYEQFLTSQNLLTAERQELILDLQHFINTGELRRPNLW